MTRPLRWWEYSLAIAVLLIVGVAALASARHQSITTDEIVHIPAGMSYLQLHDARMNPEHPPLMKVLAASPLVLGGLHLDYSLPHWTRTDDAFFGEEAFSEIGPSAARWIMASRVPMIGVMLALGITIFWMARHLAGSAGGFLALLLFATTPFFYAYGPLVHTDIGIALFALWATWTFVSVWNTPDWPHAIRFGLCLTAALLTKFTSGLLLPCFVLLAVLLTLRMTPSSRNVVKRILFSLAGIIMAAVLVYLTYFFLFWDNDTASVLSYRFEHSVAPNPDMQQLALFLKAHPGLQHLHSPPIIYLLGVAHTLHALPRTSYLLGKIYPRGTPLYFPALFLYKMPLGFLLLTALLCALCLLNYAWRPRRPDTRGRGWNDYLSALIVLLLVFSCASFASPLNIGIRHFSVTTATLTVLLGLLVPLSRNISRPVLRIATFVLLVIAVLGDSIASAAAYPNFIP